MKFVILGSPWEFYTVAYSDILRYPNVEYKKRIVNNPFLNIIRGLHLHRGINKIINLPFKSEWSKLFIKNRFDNSDDLCFIVFYDWICLNIKILETIKNNYPDAKIVVIFNDLIEVQLLRFVNKPLNIDYIKCLADLVISFDFLEAERYGLTYHPIPYSKPDNIRPTVDDNNMVDVYFLGKAKNRLDDILNVFYSLKRQNLKLKFILSGVPVEYQIDEPEISFVKGKGISYQENLINVRNTKSLLEIMQKNGTGFTSRTLEAIAYGKRLLTNNKSIIKAPFYDSQFIGLVSSFDEINPSFIEDVRSGSPVDYKYINELSPIKLLSFIESKLKLI